MAVGILLSILAGAIIGIICKNQMAATSLTIPVMMAFSFLPMISLFNKSIEKVARITYSQQISLLINSIGSPKVELENILVIALNLLVAAILLGVAFKRKGLE